MKNLREEIEKHKYLEAVPFLLTPLTAIKSIDFLFIFVSMLIAVFSTKYAIEHRKEIGNSYLIQNIIADALLLFYMVGGYPAGVLLMYSCTLINGYCTIKQRKESSIVLAAYVSQIIIDLFVEPNVYWTIPYSLLIILYSLFSIGFFASLFNYKVAVILHFLFQIILRVGNVYYTKLRFATISIMDIFAIPTFLSIAGEYNYKPDKDVVSYLIICVICIIPLLLIKNYKLNRFRMTKVVTGIMSIVMFFSIGARANYIWQNSEVRDIYFLDAFTLSAVEQVKIMFDSPNKEEQAARMDSCKSDVVKEDQIQPNIITIMNESYADVVKILGLDVNEDPLEGFYKLDDGIHTASGSVHVMTAGGGTSISEWEYLTGLNCGDFSVLRIPFATDVNCNYAFTADPLYDSYEKVFVHPFRGSGWNRPHVYETFEYDKIVFEDSMDITSDDLVRKYVSDDRLVDDIIKQIESADKPLFNMNVTMQNHGGYSDEGGTLEEKTIQVIDSEYDEEETKRLETFLQLEKLSTEALVKLVNYLKSHPEYPTVLVFFGDHYPSDIRVPQIEGQNIVSYETPYFVYCNYKEIDEMPEYMDLSLLYPNVKKAVGLPLTKWEKYLLSLDGKTADRDMILARIKYGDF